MAGENGDRRDSGFELRGEFYVWSVSDIGKDLMLIDRFTGMPVSEFFEVVEDDFDKGRAPIMLALIATSIRKGHQDWSVERITRTVMDLSLGEVVFVNDDTEEPELPPVSGATAPTGGSSASPSRSPVSAPAPERSATSRKTPA